MKTLSVRCYTVFIDLLRHYIEKNSKKRHRNKKARQNKVTNRSRINHRNIEQLNKKITLEMYSIHLRNGKAFAAEQKICELKKTFIKK